MVLKQTNIGSRNPSIVPPVLNLYETSQICELFNNVNVKVLLNDINKFYFKLLNIDVDKCNDIYYFEYFYNQIIRNAIGTPR